MKQSFKVQKVKEKQSVIAQIIDTEIKRAKDNCQFICSQQTQAHLKRVYWDAGYVHMMHPCVI